MIDLIIGNICSLLASVTDAFSASRKTPRGILLVQILSQALYGVTGIVLKGYSATVQNVVSILRNLAAIKKVNSKALEWGFVAAGVVLGLVFNNRGLVGLLPVIANLEYSLAIFRFKDNEVAIKAAFLISIFLFVIFNAAIWNVVGTVSNLVLFIVTAVFLVKAIRRR